MFQRRFASASYTSAFRRSFPKYGNSWLPAMGGGEILNAPITPVLATHIGIGAWGVAYMVEDPPQ